MVKNIISFGVLLLLFALTMFGFQPTQDNITYTIRIPVFSAEHYRIIGTVAIALSLVTLFLSINKKWTEKTEKLIEKRPAFFPIFMIFWGLYTISYLKGFAEIVSNSPPSWVSNLVFYSGFVVFLYLGWIGVNTILKK